MEENDQKDTVISYLANQLLGEVTFAQVFEMAKYQVFKQAEEAFDKMSKNEVQNLAKQIEDAKVQYEKEEAEGVTEQSE
tara:strand:- start:464 stop:700 length:237 start_codon:yes stop_codon:yes gene_type:complete